MEYNTFLNRLICNSEMTISEENVWSVIRTNAFHIDLTINDFSKTNSKFYIHYMDGDNWSNRDIWLNGKHQDNVTAMEMFNIANYKDCLIGFADEFLLIDTSDRTQDILNILKNKDFTMTTVVFEVNKVVDSWVAIRQQIFEKVHAQKAIGKGTTTNFVLK